MAGPLHGVQCGEQEEQNCVGLCSVLSSCAAVVVLCLSFTVEDSEVTFQVILLSFLRSKRYGMYELTDQRLSLVL